MVGSSTGGYADRPPPIEAGDEVLSLQGVGALSDRGLPALFRVQDELGEEDVERLAEFAANFGFKTAFGGKLSPRGLSAFEEQFRTATVAPSLRSVLRWFLGRFFVELRKPLLNLGQAVIQLFQRRILWLRRFTVSDLLDHDSLRIVGFRDGTQDLAADLGHAIDGPFGGGHTSLESVRTRIFDLLRSDRLCRSIGNGEYRHQQPGGQSKGKQTGAGRREKGFAATFR